MPPPIDFPGHFTAPRRAFALSVQLLLWTALLKSGLLVGGLMAAMVEQLVAR